MSLMHALVIDGKQDISMALA